jgi:hypothetical protein
MATFRTVLSSTQLPQSGRGNCIVEEVKWEKREAGVKINITAAIFRVCILLFVTNIWLVKVSVNITKVVLTIDCGNHFCCIDGYHT